MAEGVSPEDLPGVVNKAALSLAGCPAWCATRPKPPLALYTDEDIAVTYSGSTRVQLLCAVQPLLTGVTRVVLHMDYFRLGQPEVAALGVASLESLASLTVGKSNIQSSFWPAVWAHLPALNTLRIGREVSLGNLTAVDIFAFCSHAPRPLTLQLHQVLYDEVQGDRLQELCRLWDAPLVTLQSLDYFAELPNPISID
jgi:hypothetical protein